MKRLLTKQETDNLIIRYAKRTQRNPAILRKIVSEKYGRIEVDNHAIKYAMIDFLDRHKLVTDWKRFLLNLNVSELFTENLKSHYDAIIDEALVIIRYTNVDHFPNYQVPAYYRNFEKRQTVKN
jgi:hypothetical protein